MHRFYIIILTLFIASCADTMRSANRTLQATSDFQTNDMTWILEHRNIYFGGEIQGKDKSTLHNVKSVEACEKFNQNKLLKSMLQAKLLPNPISCIPYAKDSSLNKGLLIKQTSDLSMTRQDYYYVDHIDIATGYIIKRQDIIQATFKEYADIWLFNSIIPIITASRQKYGNDEEWKAKMDIICNDMSDSFCNS